MGIIYKGLTFDGVNSLDYGIYITGEGVYNAPTRDVELITVAGRNGDFALDKGRFNNISIVYKAGSFAKTQTEFAEKISDFRNAVLSRVGYKRLEDDYHTDEYRMAVYMNGLEVDPVHYSEAGEFDLVFNCKPQRYLKSGETEQTVTSGGTITNPTLFESAPLLLVDGYGNIDIEGQAITLENATIGEVLLQNGTSVPYESGWAELKYTTTELNAGDTVTLKPSVVSYEIEALEETITSPPSGTGVSGAIINNGAGCRININLNALNFIYNTASTQALTFNFTVVTNIQTHNITATVNVAYVKYTSGKKGVRISVSDNDGIGNIRNRSVTFGDITGESTKSALGNVYIDCEIGEAYKIEDGEVISVNNAVLLPADLPTLATGNNTITFDNTITDLKVVARWWKI